MLTNYYVRLPIFIQILNVINRYDIMGIVLNRNDVMGIVINKGDVIYY